MKLQFGDEVRRIGKPPEHVTVVMQKASDLFGIESHYFKYKDENGDFIQ